MKIRSVLCALVTAVLLVMIGSLAGTGVAVLAAVACFTNLAAAIFWEVS